MEMNLIKKNIESYTIDEIKLYNLELYDYIKDFQASCYPNKSIESVHKILLKKLNSYVLEIVNKKIENIKDYETYLKLFYRDFKRKLKNKENFTALEKMLNKIEIFSDPTQISGKYYNYIISKIVKILNYNIDDFLIKLETIEIEDGDDTIYCISIDGYYFTMVINEKIQGFKKMQIYLYNPLICDFILLRLNEKTRKNIFEKLKNELIEFK